MFTIHSKLGIPAPSILSRPIRRRGEKGTKVHYPLETLRVSKMENSTLGRVKSLGGKRRGGVFKIKRVS